ncbi:hypothetical protein ACJMK2_040901 [Sinanodonta woodiana]|uniref:Uncharacterized protein n=1 Tax=Sinanodonta woodiana TaxID=1069815 RepID=A0ABD3W5S5_SINWO
MAILYSFDRGSSNIVSPYITLVILIAGVVGGLVIVIAVILFCKYCVKKKDRIRREQSNDRERCSDRHIKPFQRYETINSDIFSEFSTGSLEGIPISPGRRRLDSRSHEKTPDSEKPTEKTTLRIDFDKSSYQEVDENVEVKDVENGEEEEEEDRADEERAKSKDVETDRRRVSFDLDNLPPATSNYLRKGRRYTDGDFHYLKKSRISKSVPRQYSLCAPLLSTDYEDGEAIELQTFSTINETLDVQEESEAAPLVSGEVISGSLFPGNNPVLTEVSVEVHQRESNRIYPKQTNVQTDVFDSLFIKAKVSHSALPRRTCRAMSYSLDIVSPTEGSYHRNRKVKSYENLSDYDYDVLKITEFSKRPLYNMDYDFISDTESSIVSKVRYNDTGSLEVLNDDNLHPWDDLELEVMPYENDDTETLNGAQKYREIWNLRTTLEEEEECSDTIRMEDTTSPDELSPDQEQGNGFDGPFESGADTAPSHNSRYGRQADSASDTPKLVSAHLLHPNYEHRRENYRNVLSNRLNPRPPTASADNSFDSIETVDTDGEVSDTSRYEVTTTSFESTTDNTDSTNDSQTSKLRQMKADSGYKSLETQQPPLVANGEKKSWSMDDEIMVEPYPEEKALEDGFHREDVLIRKGKFERRNGRTASKRRREYSRERQMVRIYDSIYEPDTDSRSDQPSGDSFEDSNAPSKFAVFSRLFKSRDRGPREKTLARDYSIDRKSNQIFQEFIRYDPEYEQTRRSSVASTRISPKIRRNGLHRKYTDSETSENTRRDHLCLEMRSTSLGSDSSASLARHISPRDSIEEEENEEDESTVEKREPTWAEVTTIKPEVAAPRLSVHEIPIIRLPEEETSEA